MSGRDRIAAMRAHLHWLIPIGVIFGLLTPIILTDRTFSTDWDNHLWLIWIQGLNIRDLGEPSYFVDSTLGVFYPYFAFYGGSAYAVLGAISAVLGPEEAVVFGYGAALAAAYLGWTWIARQLGIEGWQSQLPGCIAVTAPLAVTNLYGRGDIPEVIATSMIPLIAAAGLSMLRERRIRLHAAVAYVVGVAVLTGTHTLTLVWGTAFLALCAALLAACYWRSARERVRRVLAITGLTVLGTSINAWILMPLVVYHGRLIEREPDPIERAAYTSPGRLFSLLRDSGDPYSYRLAMADIEAQLPVLALLWAVLCGVLFWRFLSAANKKLAVGLFAIGGGLLLFVLFPGLISALPRVMQFIQFPYRVVTYVDLAVVGLVTLALAAMQREPSTARLPVLALAGIAALSFGLALNQCQEVRSWLPSRAWAVAWSWHPPLSWYAPPQFADHSAPIVRPTLDPLLFPVNARRDSYTVTVPRGPAGTARTNIATGTYLVDVSGARPVGRTPEGKMVVALPAAHGHARVVEVKAAWGAAVTFGRWLTLLSLVAALVLSAVGAASSWRRRTLC